MVGCHVDVADVLTWTATLAPPVAAGLEDLTKSGGPVPDGEEDEAVAGMR